MSKKEKIIPVRVSEEQYRSIVEFARKENISVSEYVRRRTLYISPLPPRVVTTLAGLYNLFECPQDKWNEYMRDSYKAGMRWLYGFIEDNSGSL